jgi:hypothetical protein
MTGKTGPIHRQLAFLDRHRGTSSRPPSEVTRDPCKSTRKNLLKES